MSEDIHKNKLKTAVNELPEFEPTSDLWGNISDALDFEEKVKPAIETMPESDPSEQLWGKIEAGMTGERKVFKIGFTRYIAAIAASLFIAYFGWNFFKAGNKVHEKIEYSQEIVTPTDTVAKTDTYEQQAMQYIEESCNSQPDKCEMKDITALKTELQYLDQQNQVLQEESAKFGNDPNMVKDQIKLENMKSKVIKELIQKLNS